MAVLRFKNWIWFFRKFILPPIAFTAAATIVVAYTAIKRALFYPFAEFARSFAANFMNLATKNGIARKLAKANANEKTMFSSMKRWSIVLSNIFKSFVSALALGAIELASSVFMFIPNVLSDLTNSGNAFNKLSSAIQSPVPQMNKDTVNPNNSGGSNIPLDGLNHRNAHQFNHDINPDNIFVYNNNHSWTPHQGNSHSQTTGVNQTNTHRSETQLPQNSEVRL
jgi:hypothetical protein